MACSKYISTKETTHAARVSRLLVDPCTDLFRDILRNHVTEIQFPGILQKEKSTLNPILNKVQRDQLYPRSGNFNGTYEEFDLSLLYILLRNISGITPHQRGWAKSPNPSDRSLSANIDRIREIRNTYCGHAATVSLSDTEFQKLWQNLTSIISELEGTLPGGCMTYTDAANLIETVTMDPEQEEVFLDMIDEQHQCTEDLKVKLVTQGTEITGLKAEQHRQGSELKILVDERHRQEKRHDSESRNILENSLAVLKAHTLKKVNIRTSGVQTTIEKLRDNHIAILTGKGGTGKTTTAYQVMCEMSDSSLESSYTPVLIHSPEEWNKVINPNHRFIVYLDDFIGSTNLDTSAFEKWKNHLDIIFSCAMTGNVLVLMGLRRNILVEAKKFFVHAVIDDKNIVDLSSKENFTVIDKEKMLEAYVSNCTFKASEMSGDTFSAYAKKNGPDAVYKLSKYEKKAILLSDSYYGFPLTSFQFFSRRDFFQLGPSYFEHPDEKLFEAIEKMRRAKCGNISEKVKYCVLCYVFIKGSIETNNVSDALFTTICEKLRITDILEIDVKDAINDLNGLYLFRLTKKDLYEFSHETILETVMASFGQIAPDIVIKSCKRKKVHELIRTENYEAKPGEVVLKIPRLHYEDLSQRLLRADVSDDEQVVTTRWLGVDILQFPGFEDPEFVSVFCKRELSGSLSSLFHNFFQEGFMFVYNKNKYNVLLWELLERYGPHHASPVLQMSEQKFEITTEHIENLLQSMGLSSLLVGNSLKTILSYVFKYRDVSDILCLLQTNQYEGLFLLHRCVINGWEDMVDTILEIDTPKKAKNNWSCAHLAAFAGRSLILQKFINLGQDITERTSEGYSVLQTALLGLRFGDQKVISPSSTVDSLNFFNGFCVSFPESDEFSTVIHGLLKKSTKCKIVDLVMALDEYGNNIVHYLVMHNYRDILGCLLNYDKEFVFHRNTSDLPTALHVAVYLGRPEMVRKLWTLGVRPRNSDLSLMETRHKGERFCNKVISRSPLRCRDGHKLQVLNNKWNFKMCWNDGDKEVLNIKLKAIEKVKVVFGSVEEFQNVQEFLLDKL